MALNVRALKREYNVRFWSRVITENPYVVVVQITGGRMWGRTNTKARLLGGHSGPKGANARLAVPNIAREGALRTKFVGLSELFRGAPSAVVFGNDVGDVTTVLRRAREVLDGAFVAGGRFGDRIVTARVWEEVCDGEGERAEWERLVGVVGKRPEVVQILDEGGRRLVRGVEEGGRARALTGVLEHVGDGMTG